MIIIEKSTVWAVQCQYVQTVFYYRETDSRKSENKDKDKGKKD